MFGLQNHGGSCWLNACLQSIFRLPEIKSRYSGELVPINSIDESLHKIWTTKGEGLKELFAAINTDANPAYEMLAGRSIGDSNEALLFLCDKLPFLDELCRYHIVEKIECKCGFTQERKDSHIQFELYPTRNSVLTECISNVVKSEILDTWKCDQCSERGSASKHVLMKSFPKYFVFKLIGSAKVQYSTILVINSNRYQLMSVTAFNGSHWWAYSKDEQWAMYDDSRVRQLRSNEYPTSSTAKMLIYYRLN
jgi:ubiquitin C-terminal hydrolase